MQRVSLHFRLQTGNKTRDWSQVNGNMSRYKYQRLAQNCYWVTAYLMHLYNLMQSNSITPAFFQSKFNFFGHILVSIQINGHFQSCNLRWCCIGLYCPERYSYFCLPRPKIYQRVELILHSNTVSTKVCMINFTKIQMTERLLYWIALNCWHTITLICTSTSSFLHDEVIKMCRWWK